MGFEVMCGYFSPVSDKYKKKGLVGWRHRVEMCRLACCESDWIDTDMWEALQEDYVYTADALDHVYSEANSGGGCVIDNEGIVPYRVMLLSGSDLVKSFGVKGLWSDTDLDRILGQYGCVVVERLSYNISNMFIEHEMLHKHRKSVFLVKQYITNKISSTKIRRGLSIKFLVPDSVREYIKDNSLYISTQGNFDKSTLEDSLSEGRDNDAL